MGNKKIWICLSIILFLPVSPARADERTCTVGGGQYIKGQCYCVRTKAVPNWQAEDKALKGDKNCPSLWGMELTFTNVFLQRENVALNSNQDNPIEVEGPKSKRAKEDWLREMVKICKKRVRQNAADRCTVDGHKVTYADGYYYVVSTDPGVVEIQGRPLSQGEWIKLSDRIERDIFKVARDAANLVPHRSVGSGHLHLDIASHFKGNFRLLLDFLIDFQNHPFLSICALGENFITNPPLAIQNTAQVQRFKEITQSWKGLNSDPMTMAKIGSKLAHLKHEVFYDTLADLDDPDKFQAIGLNHVQDFGSIEIRALRPEQNAHHVQLLMQLFEQRIAYLKLHPGQIYQQIELLTPQIPRGEVLKSEPAFRKFYDTPEYKQRCLDEFYDYVHESGLQWEDYKAILYEENQTIVPSRLRLHNE